MISKLKLLLNYNKLLWAISINKRMLDLILWMKISFFNILKINIKIIETQILIIKLIILRNIVNIV